jgi:hypothetical protein
MKRFSFGLLAGLLIGLMLAGSTVFASPAIKLIINGQEIICDTPPQNINGRVMVPARFVAEALGAIVTWDSADNAVLIASKSGSGSIPAPTISHEESEKQEFLAISKEVEAWIMKFPAELEGNVTDAKRESILSDVEGLQDKLAVWGQLYPYSGIKKLYINALTDISIACINKNMADSSYSKPQYVSEYEKYKRTIDLHISGIQAEKTRLQKLGYL